MKRVSIQKANEKSADDQRCQIFIGGMHPHTTSNQVKTFFSNFGPVKDVVVKYNEEGMCKGFAFLTFEDESSVLKAAANHENNYVCDKWVDVRRLGDFSSAVSPPENNRVASGGTVRVDPGQMDVGRTIFVGGLPWDIVADTVKELKKNFLKKNFG